MLPAIRFLSLQAIVASVIATGVFSQAQADVQVNINLGPPPIMVPEPPALVLVPGSQVYFVPELQYDLFYYHGYWWSLRGDRWYRAGAYDGPWRVIERRYVPAPVYRMPRDYRRVYDRERHIPYGQWHREHGRDHDRGWRGGHGGRGEGGPDRGEHHGWEEHDRGR